MLPKQIVLTNIKTQKKMKIKSLVIALAAVLVTDGILLTAKNIALEKKDIVIRDIDSQDHTMQFYIGMILAKTVHVKVLGNTQE